MLQDAADDEGQVLSETRSVYIRVADKGDNPPTWLNYPAFVEEEENHPIVSGR